MTEQLDDIFNQGNGVAHAAHVVNKEIEGVSFEATSDDTCTNVRSNGALVQVVKRLEEERYLTPFSIKTPETVLLRRKKGKPCPTELVSNPQFLELFTKMCDTVH